jgi:uncharacterized protein (TIGR00288 family)
MLKYLIFVCSFKNWEKEKMELLRKLFLKKKRVAILIDGENLYNALVNLGKVGIDMKLLVDRVLQEEERLVRDPIFYTSVKTTISEQRVNFFEYLMKQGFQVKYKPLSMGQDPKSEIDPEIAVGICKFATQKDIDTIVLVSGDHHFVPAVKFAKEKGKKIRVVCSKDLLSLELAKVADEFIDLQPLVKEIPQKSEIEIKREKALQALKEGKKVILPTLEEAPKNDR